jgi:hypothetical protein
MGEKIEDKCKLATQSFNFKMSKSQNYVEIRTSIQKIKSTPELNFDRVIRVNISTSIQFALLKGGT